jgi:hypothetical protein
MTTLVVIGEVNPAKACLLFGSGAAFSEGDLLPAVGRRWRDRQGREMLALALMGQRLDDRVELTFDHRVQLGPTGNGSSVCPTGVPGRLKAYRPVAGVLPALRGPAIGTRRETGPCRPSRASRP